MQAKLSDLEALLSAENNRQAMGRLESQIQELRSGAALRELENKRIELAGRLNAATSNLEALQVSSNRAAADLQLVESRIDRDNERLTSSSSPKDINGIQHELETLRKRKSELEDVELGLLEEIELKQNEVLELQAERESLSDQLRIAHEASSMELSRLELEKSSLREAVEAILASVDSELAALYLAKSERGIAIGRLANLTCTACNMGITSSAFRELTAAASDALVLCPECSAILVRS